MYLHILDRACNTRAVINTRKSLSTREVADLAHMIQNPTFTEELQAYKAYMALPGVPDKQTQRVLPDEFQGVGVLSTFTDLNKIKRFTSGDMLTENIPKQLRGVALLTFLNTMSKQAKPPKNMGKLSSPWSTSTNPRKASSVTSEQITWAKTLKGQEVGHRKIADMTGIPYGSLTKLFAVGH